jgi:glycosyltransferase involved in cell wall biosynthesis
MSNVAVVMRTKDRPLLLERALKSVAGQTYREFTLVIINDGGQTEPVDALVKKYGQKFSAPSQVKVIHNKSSKGMEAASNKAIKSVDSTYVAIHDDDDTWAPHFLEKAVGHLEATGSMGVVVTTDRVVERIEDGVVKKLSQDRWLPDLRSITLYDMCLDNYTTPITFLYRREVYEAIGYYEEDMTTGADWYFGLQFLLRYDIDFLKTDDALAFYHHRPHPGSTDMNSVYSAEHEQNLTRLKNKLLREDLAAGRIGLGYIINSVRHDYELERESRALTASKYDVSQAEARLLQTETQNMERIAALERLIIERTSISSVGKRAGKAVKKLSRRSGS